MFYGCLPKELADLQSNFHLWPVYVFCSQSFFDVGQTREQAIDLLGKQFCSFLISTSFQDLQLQILNSFGTADVNTKVLW